MGMTYEFPGSLGMARWVADFFCWEQIDKRKEEKRKEGALF